MKRQGGGRVSTPYNDVFFLWWWRQIISMDDYPYAGINFRGDPDMSLPPRASYGAIGKKKFTNFIFLYFEETKIFLDGV
jgi:hypothetical protein